jgi:hypothetical protein
MFDKLKLSLVSFLLAVASVQAQPAVAAKPEGYTVAIFVANRAGNVGNDRTRCARGLHHRQCHGPQCAGHQRRDGFGRRRQHGARRQGNELDAQLAQSTSAVRLAQTLGATHLLQVSITGFESNKRTIAAYGVKTTNDERTVTRHLQDSRRQHRGQPRGRHGARHQDHSKHG